MLGPGADPAWTETHPTTMEWGSGRPETRDR